MDPPLDVEAKVVQVALAQGYLAPIQLREALAVREELARRGHRVDLLTLLQERYLAPRAVAALTPIYRQAVSGSQTHVAPSVPVAQALTPDVLALARAAVNRPPSSDVQAFMERTRLVPAVGSDVARTSGSGELARAPDRGPGPRGVSGSDVGAAFPDTAVLPAAARGPRPASSDEIQPVGPRPERYGRYVVEAELARGGMGVVYRALDPQLERRVALKVVQGDGLELEQRDVERFLREARATARMRHPGIVSVLDSGTERGQPYLVMDLVEGESLAERLKQTGPLEPLEAARLCAQIARALDACHQEGVLHRDVKPSNVLVDSRSGAPLLTDFGLARSERDANTLTATGQAVGTPSYMAPEQAAGEREQLGPATDVYGLGATLYHLMLGRPPFQGGTLDVMRRVLTDAPVPPRKLRESIPPQLEAICLRCLEKEPQARFPSAIALADALEALAAPRPSRPAPGGGRGPQRSPPGLVGRLILGAVTAVALVGLALSYRARADALAEVDAPQTPSATPSQDREALAARYLAQLASDPAHAAAFELLRHQPQDALPWQVAQGLEDAPHLPTQTVVTAVVLGLDDRFADADALLAERPDALPLRSALRLQAGDPRAALEVLADAGDEEPAVHARVRALFVGQDYDGAVAAAAHLPEGHPLREAALEEESLVRLSSGQDWLPRIERLLQASPCSCARYRLLLYRAQALLDLDRYGAVEEALTQAEALRPGAPHVRFFRYLLRLEQQDFPGAARALEATLEVERVPVERVRSRWFLAEALFLSGEAQRARALLPDLEQDPRSEQLGAHLRARVLLQAGAHERALTLALSGWNDRGQAPAVRAMSLEVVIGVLRAQGRWAELKQLVLQVSEAQEALPNYVFPILDRAYADAERALGGK
ncbi:MAG: serine/threonine-protein kinase [Planctomycetota bacterium]